MAKMAKWKTTYLARITQIDSLELIDEIVEQASSIGDEFYDERAAWCADAAAEELKGRLRNA